MFDNFVLNFIQRFAPKSYETILNRGVYAGRKAEEEERKKDQEKLREFKLYEFDRRFPYGSFVIAVPNEACNPVIGRIINYMDTGSKHADPILTVYDYVRQEEVSIPCFTMPFSEEFLKAVMAQDVYGRHLSYYRSHKNFQTIDSDLIHDLDTMKKLLSDNGFYDDLSKYEASLDEK